MRKTSLAVFFFILAYCAGCASTQYQYEPTDTSLVKVGKEEGASYEIPSDSNPEGQIKIASFGVVNLGLSKDLPNIRAMHMRLVLENKSKTNTWEINTRKQFLSLSNEGRSEAAYTNSGEKFEDLPKIKIAPGQKKTVDLYYPLPQNLAKASEIPKFKFKWRVSTDHHDVTKTISFERFQVITEPPAIYTYYPYGNSYPLGLAWGPTWWYDPNYYQWSWNNPVTVYPLPQ